MPDLFDPSTPGAPVSQEERLERRAQISALEAHMKSLPGSDQLGVDPMTSHLFATGVYCRRVDIPAGVVCIGKIHRTEHLTVLLSGRVRVTTEEGTTELEGPAVWVAPPGVKRVAHALTDVAWLTLHAVGAERDIEKIEQSFIADSFEALERETASAQIGEVQ